MPVGTIRPCERRWALTAALLVLALSSLPYLAGRLSQTADLRFGGAIYDRQDVAVHLASIRLGMRGEWAYQFLATPEPHPAAHVKGFYLALGHLARLMGLQPLSIYHLARWGFGLAALLEAYAFAAFLLRPVALRRLAFLFFALGSGLGWLQLLLGWLPAPDLFPIDFWLVDAYGFFSLLTFPHFAAAFWLLLIMVRAVAGFFDGGSGAMLGQGLAAALALQWVQPFAPAIGDLALAGYVALGWVSERRIRWRDALGLMLLGALQIPLLLYSLRVFSGHPLWRTFRDQNITLSPPPTSYLLGYGLLTPLALWGLWLALRRPRRRGWRLPAAWVLGAALMAYMPFSLQRRFTEGLIAPIAVLAAIALGYGLLPWLRRRLRMAQTRWRKARNLGLALLVAAASLSSLYLAFGGSLLASMHHPPLFDPVPLTEALDWLGEREQWRIPLFAAERTGLVALGQIGQRVYLAHVIETADYRAKQRLVADFFGDAMTDVDRRRLLADCGCRLLLYGPYERELGNWDPAGADILQQVYARDGVAIYRLAYP